MERCNTTNSKTFGIHYSKSYDIHKRKSYGFTIVELVIVIAVIAVLAAVLIPTFSGIIDKANLSNDQVATNNMNTILSVEKDPSNKISADDVKTILKEAGYDTGKLTPLTKGFTFYWIEDAQIIVLYDEENEKIIFPTNSDIANLVKNDGWIALSGFAYFNIKYHISGLEGCYIIVNEDCSIGKLEYPHINKGLC